MSFKVWCAPLPALLAVAVPASAAETINYSYDVLGRLVKVAHSGTINTGATSCYSYDPANNRSNVAVATASDCSGSAGGVSFSISNNGAVTEGANSIFTIAKTGTATTSLSVDYATANNTAVAPGDYTAKPTTTLTFTTAQASQTVSVATIDDVAAESAETFDMTLSAPTGGATLGTATATASINDNDSGGGTCTGISFSVSDSTVFEGAALTFIVTKSGSTTTNCGVNYATANGTALAGSDYGPASGTLTFASGEVTKTVSISTVFTVGTEVTETMYLYLSAASIGATISDAQGIGKIKNDN